MNARQRRVVAVAVVVSIAIALAAATLDSTIESEPTSGERGDRPVVEAVPPTTGSGGAFSIAQPCVPWLTNPAVVVALLAAFGIGTVLVYRRYTRFEAVAFATGIGLPASALYLLLTDCATNAIQRDVRRRIWELPLDPSDAGNGVGPALTMPPLLMAAILLVALSVVVFVLYSSFTGSGDASLSVDETDATDDAAAHGAAQVAGEAADRLERGADLTTETYRAWRDMAAHLNVARPRASTPGEFADAAIESGLNPAAVRELTELFERVRYGGFEETTASAERARAALRRIEDSSRRPVFEDPSPDDEATDE